MKQEQRRFTAAELALLRKLRSEGIGYSIIAQRLGRSINTLRNTMVRPPRIPIDEREARREDLVRQFEETKSLQAVAARNKRSVQAICMALNRAGLDGEMRRAIRRGVAP